MMNSCKYVRHEISPHATAFVLLSVVRECHRVLLKQVHRHEAYFTNLGPFPYLLKKEIEMTTTLLNVLQQHRLDECVQYVV